MCLNVYCDTFNILTKKKNPVAGLNVKQRRNVTLLSKNNILR